VDYTAATSHVFDLPVEYTVHALAFIYPDCKKPVFDQSRSWSWPYGGLVLDCLQDRTRPMVRSLVLAKTSKIGPGRTTTSLLSIHTLTG
jgi:hypothetical protein